MEQQIVDTIPFLSLSHRSEVRLQALRIIEGLTSTPGAESVLPAHGAIPFLVRMIGEDAYTRAALNSLINLFGASRDARSSGVEVEVVQRIMDLLRSSAVNTDLAIMALVNVTAEKSACDALVQENTKLRGSYLRRLMQHWANTLVPDVFVNVAQIRSGRQLLMHPSMDLLRHIAMEMASRDPARRRSVLRLMRNIAFDVEYHDALLSEEIVVPLLLGLVGPEPMKDSDTCGMLPEIVKAMSGDKQRDSDRDARFLTVQILAMFVPIHKSRKFFKRIQLYPILRDLHLSEEERDEEMTGAIEDLIPYLVAADPRDQTIADEFDQ